MYNPISLPQPGSSGSIGIDFLLLHTPEFCQQESRKFGSPSLPPFFSPFPTLMLYSYRIHISPFAAAWKPRELFLAGQACYKTEESVYGGLGLSLLFLPSD